MRKPSWYQYASMGELLDGLSDSASDRTELNEITIYIHVRVLRPILALTLLFMSLPLVLGGYGRNMFINLGFALGNSAHLLRRGDPLPVPGLERRPAALAGGLAAAVHLRPAGVRAMGLDPDLSNADRATTGWATMRVSTSYVRGRRPASLARQMRPWIDRIGLTS